MLSLPLTLLLLAAAPPQQTDNETGASSSERFPDGLERALSAKRGSPYSEFLKAERDKANAERARQKRERQERRLNIEFALAELKLIRKELKAQHAWIESSNKAPELDAVERALQRELAELRAKEMEVAASEQSEKEELEQELEVLRSKGNPICQAGPGEAPPLHILEANDVAGDCQDSCRIIVLFPTLAFLSLKGTKQGSPACAERA